jgi:hypothetical protein
MKYFSQITKVLTKAKNVALYKEKPFCSQRMHVFSCIYLTERIWWCLVMAQNFIWRVIGLVPD